MQDYGQPRIGHRQAGWRPDLVSCFRSSMKKCFALSKTFGLTPFGPRAPRSGRRPKGAARRGETAPRLLQDLTPPPA
jgi:hypothetical protein